LLFPIVGVVAGGKYRLGSASFELSRHGFARGKDFSVTATQADGATFKLTSDASTLKVYPFEFELLVQFALRGATMSVTTTIRNLGNANMPASFGYHPAFRWPLPFGGDRASHTIDFDSDEPDPVRRIDEGGLLTPTPHPTPIKQRRLVLTDDMFQNDVLILDRVRSRSVSYGGETGPRLRIGLEGAPYLGVWTKPGAPFICIEPWHGVTDPEGFTGDFKNKPGVFIVGAGRELALPMTVTLEGR
jgi:galactose mutarotase-like enzyme